MKHLILTILLSPFALFSQHSIEEVNEMREEHLNELLDTSTHILSIEEVNDFKGLDYFAYDSTYVVNTKLKKRPGKPFEMITTTERRPIYRRYGFLIFKLNGKRHKLEVYQPVIDIAGKSYEDYLFIPFRDKTSANESYGGGRYLDLEIPDGKSVTIDFNLSYNPYCAYSHRYSCPVPPEQNTLEVKIEAGEKTPLAH